MDKVLKRVGLSKRGSEIKNKQSVSPEHENSVMITKRRRCENRKFLHEKKLRGLFNIDWESVKDCKSCKSRAMTRKLCGKRCDNELYRSNSFKFERFVRCGDDISSFEQRVSLCDDYSLPIDYVKKKRSKNVIQNPSEWNVTSPNDDQIKILGTQPDPKDHNQSMIEREFFTSSNRKCVQPYISEYSSDSSSNEEFSISCEESIKYNSSGSIIDTTVPLPSANINILVASPKHIDIKRYPSPYYYADLYKSKQINTSVPNTQTKKDSYVKKVTTVQETSKSSDKEEDIADNDKNQSHRNYKRSFSLETPPTNSVKTKDINPQSFQKCCKVDTEEIDTSKIKVILDCNSDSEQAKILNEIVSESSSCTSAFFPSQIVLNEDDMTRKRHLYETAFDCSVTLPEGEVDQIDKVSNHPVLIQLTNIKKNHVSTGSSTDCDTQSCKIAICQDESTHSKSLDTISQNLQDMHLESKEESSKISETLLLRLYASSPPSRNPLSKKYYNKSNVSNSTGSASNTPNNIRGHHRTKDLRLPVKSLHVKRNINLSKNDPTAPLEFKEEIGKEPKNELEIKSRTKKMFKHNKDESKEIFRYAKGCRRRHKYSSTESITTSSSGESMESLHSSTSEGNRSTSSSESRQSTSLSSHSSDSGNTSYHLPQTYNFLMHSNKINILSPISDKSSQEPVSETSDNNKNNNSQKCSPDEISSPTNAKPKRRLPLNKNIFNFGFHSGDTEIQGSDSGISIQSREGKTIFGFMVAPNKDFSDLPFDMPKLRCRRMLQEDACTSGSATSVDLRDLPFDMPKLKRRLRLPQSHVESMVSHTSSSQSVADIDKQVTQFKPVLSLNLKDDAGARKRMGLNLSLGRLGLNLNIKNNTTTNEMVDISLPLERQGWYHGAITRIEAEFVLKFLQEGSFLVRNSESTRQDYSLSLKSARGFMHMRIQRNEADSFILGQFSKPFKSIPEMIHHFSLNRLPVRGAEHMCLLQPVISQLL